LSGVLTPVDPSAQSRLRRKQARRRQVRRRRLTALAIISAAIAGLIAGIELGGHQHAAQQPAVRVAAPVPSAHVPTQQALPTPPDEIRGVHVTMTLASIPGKLASYIALKKDGLNTIELDVKDENGEIGFVPSSVPLARKLGAARAYYRPRDVARRVHAAGLYLIGRVVSFEDPIAAERAPQLAIRRSDGSIWHTNGGLGWLNPYDRRTWKYNVDIAAAAARAGFDEIQFDYVRFPSDGDLSIIRYPGKHAQSMSATVPAYLRYAVARLHPLGVRVSADVFGLSARRDLGIGQHPRALSRVLDTIYPMVYPSHYNPGEYNLEDPEAAPGTVVAYSLRDFRHSVRHGRALIVPWLQDFSLRRTYDLVDVQAQIAAARNALSSGFLLWNPNGVYTARALGTGPRPLEPLETPQL
jgi:hypothetical protein